MEIKRTKWGLTLFKIVTLRDNFFETILSMLLSIPLSERLFGCLCLRGKLSVLIKVHEVLLLMVFLTLKGYLNF